MNAIATDTAGIVLCNDYVVYWSCACGHRWTTTVKVATKAREEGHVRLAACEKCCGLRSVMELEAEILSQVHDT